MSDLPDYQRNIQIVAGEADVAEYSSAPADIGDGERGPILVDIKGRPYTLADLIKLAGTAVATEVAGKLPVTADIRKILGYDVAAGYGAGVLPIGIATSTIAYNACTDAFTVDMIDDYLRQLGIIYGSQSQPLQQKATTYELLTDPADRAARLLGVVYGSQAQKLQQKATSYELLTYDSYVATLLNGGLPAALDSGALKIKEQSPLSTLAVTQATYANLKAQINLQQLLGSDLSLTNYLPVGIAYPAGTLIDPRSIRNLTAVDVVSAAQSGAWAVKLWDGTYYLATPQAGDAIGRGVFLYGSDYASPTPAARIAKVDSSGRLSCVLG